MSKSSLCTTTGATSDGSPGELRGLGDAAAGTWAQTILRTSSHAVTAIKQFFILEIRCWVEVWVWPRTQRGAAASSLARQKVRTDAVRSVVRLLGRFRDAD